MLASVDNAAGLHEPPKIRHCERSEATSSFKARLLRCTRKDEVHGQGCDADIGGKLRQLCRIMRKRHGRMPFNVPLRINAARLIAKKIPIDSAHASLLPRVTKALSRPRVAQHPPKAHVAWPLPLVGEPAAPKGVRASAQQRQNTIVPALGNAQKVGLKRPAPAFTSWLRF